MRFSPLVDRIAGKGADAWALHAEALKQKRAGRKDVILLSVGDPDFDTPSVIIDVAIKALRSGDTHYSDIIGFPETRKAIAQYHFRLTGQEVDLDNVAVLAGAQCALFATALLLFAPGDEVLVPEPAYVTYEGTVQASGARIVPVPARPEKGFHIDPLDLERAVTSRTKAILFATPNNPTGAILSFEELEAVRRIAIRHDLWVISDEVYASLVFDQSHVSIASLPDMAERTVTINSVSKSHAMTGWRAGWMVGPKELIRHMGKLGLSMLYGSPPFIQRAIIAALSPDHENIVSDMREAYRKRRDRAVGHLNQVPGLRCHPPEGGMFLMLDVRETGQSSKDFSWNLFEKTGVCTLDASAFGPSAAGHLRLGLVVDGAILDDACRRIASFANALKVE